MVDVDGYGVIAAPTTSGSTLVAAVPLDEVQDTAPPDHGRHRRRGGAGRARGGCLLARPRRPRPLQRMEIAAGQIAAGDLSQRVEPATERTEVGRLGLALNAMLGQIEGAFAERTASENKLRRFLSDASHELRTPLASIRGYAELYRTGPPASPPTWRRR